MSPEPEFPPDVLPGTGFDGFRLAQIAVGEVSLRLRHCGSGPPLLLLHGYPETHLMWGLVAGELAKEFTVVAPDLVGYPPLPCRGPGGGAGTSKAGSNRARTATLEVVVGHDSRTPRC